MASFSGSSRDCALRTAGCGTHIPPVYAPGAAAGCAGGIPEGEGIPHAIYYPVPLHLQKAFAMSGGKPGVSAAETAAAEVISLPMHTELNEEHLLHITGAMREFYADRSSSR